MKVLKDTFSQLEKVSISSTILNRRKTKALEEEEKAKLYPSNLTTQIHPQLRKAPSSQVSLHRRTNTDFFELTSTNFIENPTNARRLKSYEAKTNFLRKTLYTQGSKQDLLTLKSSKKTTLPPTYTHTPLKSLATHNNRTPLQNLHSPS